MNPIQKIENLENALRANYQQQGWLHTYTKLTKALKEHTDRLYELSRRQTANSKEAEDLSRYETFEAIQDKFLFMRLLDEMNADNRQALQRIVDDMDFASQKEEDERTLLASMQKTLDESRRHMKSVSDRVERVYHIQGARNVLNVDIQSLQDIIAGFGQKKEALAQDKAEQNSRLSALQTELDTLRTGQQVLAPHRSMLAQGPRLLLSLSVMSNLKSELDTIDVELHDNAQRQQALSNALNDLTLAHTNVKFSIETLKTQLKSHRESIRGTDSATLQRRALTLDNQRMLLLCARIHWGHVRHVHNEIRNAASTLSVLRNRIEGVRVSLAKVDKEVSELQAEYRYHAAVLQAKLRQQEELQKELIELQTREDVLNESLQQLQTSLSQLMDEWQHYAPLDASFAECSPSTNMEARSEMLTLLLANTERSAKEAAEELDNFNFHHDRIHALGDELRDRESKQAQTEKQMGDVNTELQVLQRLAEYLNKRHATSHARFTAVYNELNAVITLPDWMKQWEANNEEMSARIADMVERWDTSRLQSQKLQRDMQEAASMLRVIEEQESFIDTCIQRLADVLESRTTMLEEGESELQQALAGAREDDFYESSFQRLLEACGEVERQTSEYLKASSLLHDAQGRHASLQSVGKRMEEQLSLLRYNLDVWISQYNSSHSPVQYDELKRTFSLQTDWNSLRQRTRDMQASIAVEEEMIRYLKAELAELRSTASRASTDVTELTLWNLQKQMDSLRTELRDLVTTL